MSILQGLWSHLYWLLRSFISWQSLFLFVCTIALCVVWQVVQFSRGRKAGRENVSVRHLIAVYIFLFYLMYIYRLTGLVGLVWWLRSPLIPLDRIGLIPFATVGNIVPEILNIIMTIPFGFLLAAIWPEFRSLKKVMLAGFLFSLTIESMQLFTLRFSTTGDLITNTLGAVIGYLIFAILFRLLGRIRSKERVINRGIRYEAVVYIALSLIGVMVFQHPSIVNRIHAIESPVGTVEFGIGRDLFEGMEYALVIVTEISEDQIQGEVLQRIPAEAFDAESLSFTVTSFTGIRISIGHGQGHEFRLGTIEDILPGDRLDVFGYQNEGEFFATEITITRD